MSELITDEMVEVAREALDFDQFPGQRDKNIRAALEAAAPLIAGQALREAADDLDLPGSTATGYYASEAVGGYNDAERDTEAWLVKRAAQIEGVGPIDPA